MVGLDEIPTALPMPLGVFPNGCHGASIALGGDGGSMGGVRWEAFEVAMPDMAAAGRTLLAIYDEANSWPPQYTRWSATS
jgi:hypothetical protein